MLPALVFAGVLTAAAPAAQVRMSVRHVGPGISAPVLLTAVAPKYPQAAIDTRTSGLVIVEAVVSADGAVVAPRLVKSADQKTGLDAAALVAVRQWTFTPGARVNAAGEALAAVPVLVWLQVEFTPPSEPRPAVPARKVVTTRPAALNPGPVAAADVLPPGAPNVAPPALLRDVQPNYTVDAARAQVEGTVEVRGVILPDGTFAEPKVVRSLDRATGLDQEAAEAAKLWLFEPCRRDGVPVACSATLAIEFRLR